MAPIWPIGVGGVPPPPPPTFSGLYIAPPFPHFYTKLKIWPPTLNLLPPFIWKIYALENAVFILQSMGRTNHKFPIYNNTDCSNAPEINCTLYLQQGGDRFMRVGDMQGMTPPPVYSPGRVTRIVKKKYRNASAEEMV